MHDLNDFYYFVKAVEFGGFAPASRALGVPKSKLSRRIAGLEEKLGVVLIYRSTRQFKMTEIGETFFSHCKAMLIEAEAAQEAIEFSHAEPCGVVKLTCPVALLHVDVGQVIASFMAKYPKVTVQLAATNRKVDLVAEGIDIAIRARPAPFDDSELILKVLAERRLCLVASPMLLEKHPKITSPIALATLPSLGLGEPQHAFDWTLYHDNGEKIKVPFQPRFITTDMLALRCAAISGIGIVQLPKLMVIEQLNNQQLVPILPHWQAKKDIIHAIYPSRRGMLPAVRALLDYLGQYYQEINNMEA